MPDFSTLLSQPLGDIPGLGRDHEGLPDWDSSQFISGSIEQPRAEPVLLEDDHDLGLDWAQDEEPALGFDEGTSIERGRNAPLERRMSEELASSPKLLPDDDLGLDFGEDDTTAMPGAGNMDIADVDMLGMSELGMPIDEATIADLAPMEARDPERVRDSISPLSSIRSSVERDLEQTFQGEHNATAFELAEEQEEEEAVRQNQRVKRRRLLHADAETQIPNTQLRQQQNDRSKILKPSSFLPRDPMLLALMNMQKSGGFVSSILGDGRTRGWAPELRGILSLEVVSRPGQKRKRNSGDSGVADLGLEEDEAAARLGSTPQLEFDQTEHELDIPAPDLGGDISLAQEDDMVELPADEGIGAPEEELLEEEEDAFSPADNFDDTTAPLLHPAESGPISVGTKHAVHLLRERFGEEAETSESQRQKASVLFQDMLPEATTTRADATKMFFEVLVLATKDAIKVEQPADELGGPLRIRGKRGLWGSWAETSAGGELASQAAPATSPAVVAEA
jgi:cohesin complex subunit SCC1